MYPVERRENSGMQFVLLYGRRLMAVFFPKLQPGDAPPDDPFDAVPGPGTPLIAGLSGSGKFRALGELIKENILFHYSINQRGRQTRLLLVFEMVKLRYVPIEGRMVLLFL